MSVPTMPGLGERVSSTTALQSAPFESCRLEVVSEPVAPKEYGPGPGAIPSGRSRATRPRSLSGAGAFLSTVFITRTTA